MRLASAVILSLALAGCGNQDQLNQLEAQRATIEALTSEAQKQKSEIDAAHQKIRKLEEENEELRKTPPIMLAAVVAASEKGEEENARRLSDELSKRFSASSEALSAAKIVEKMISTREAKEKEAARVASLGFKAIPVRSTFEADEATLNLTGAQIGSQWRFDDHGYQYSYKTAARGNRYVVAQVAVSSKSNDPKLPQVAVYASNGSQLQRLGVMDYEFVRWKDYGAYLGNYHDYSNDFSRTERIRFTIGAEVKTDALTKPIYIVAAKPGCASRVQSNYGNPPVLYMTHSCSQLPETLKIENFSDAQYGVLRRID